VQPLEVDSVRTVGRVLERLDRVERRNGYYTALCPAHADRKPSLSISETDDGRALLHCHAGCKPENIVAELGLEMRDLFPRLGRNGKGHRKIVGSYDYHDADGRMLFQTLRMEPKDFRQRRPDGRGGWEWNLNGVEPVLYRLQEVLLAVESGETIFVPSRARRMWTRPGAWVSRPRQTRWVRASGGTPTPHRCGAPKRLSFPTTTDPVESTPGRLLGASKTRRRA